jgi:hypothetical protein
MTYSFHAYIDESGDDGMQSFRKPGVDGGASRWLVIGACLVRASRDLELVRLRDRIRSECTPTKTRRDIHFKDFNHVQRKRACQLIAEQPVRFSCVLGLKDAPEAAAFTEKNQLYFYLSRFLIERISWFCRDYRELVSEGDGRVKITFSRRGGMSYPEFQHYLRRLQANGDTEVHWPVIDIDGVEAADHSRKAALQIADCGVTAVAQAIEPDKFGNVESSYIDALAGNIYSRHGNYLSYGLKSLPRLDEAGLNQHQASIFQRFK